MPKTTSGIRLLIGHEQRDVLHFTMGLWCGFLLGTTWCLVWAVLG